VIVLGYEISRRGIKVNKAKIEVIAKPPTLKCIKDIPSFLGYIGIYRRFIKDFSKIDRPLTNLLAKDVPSDFDDGCHRSREKFKKKLISTYAPDWTKPFEIMCDAIDLAIGTVLGQLIDNKQHVIYYSISTLNDAQQNYILPKKNFLL